MDNTPAFQLTHSTRHETDPEQANLFSPNGEPVRDWLDSEALRFWVEALLFAARLPGSHRRGYADHLRDGVLIDLGLVVSLGALGPMRRWRGLFWNVDVMRGWPLGAIKPRAAESDPTFCRVRDALFPVRSASAN